VRGYKEKGNINTPLELAIEQRDRPLQPGDRCDRPRARAHVKEEMRDRQIDCRRYAYEHGIDKPEIRDCSNQMLADWLVELGCEVSRRPVRAGWRIGEEY
jgi:phosphoketolase